MGIPGVKDVKLPDKLTFQHVTAKDLVVIKDAAKLAGIHPVVLEMGRYMLKRPNEGATFKLATPELKKQADAIHILFKAGLKKVVRALGADDKPMTLKSMQYPEKLVFWYEPLGWSRQAKTEKDLDDGEATGD